MWKCMGLLLFFVQWIIVTSEPVNEDGISRLARKTDDCCSCPEATARNSDSDHSASEKHDMTCPCTSRSADSEAASSIFSPAISALQPFARQNDKKGDLKPLLEPEVDLASSVLKTLREATEEEYQEALVRDAARSAIQSALSDESLRDIDNLVVSPDVQENIDDVLSEASNNQERRCIYPISDDYSNMGAIGNSFSADPPYGGSLYRASDLHNAPSNFYDSLNLPNGRDVPDTLGLTGIPLQNLFRNVPVLPGRDLSFSPSETLNRFAPVDKENMFFRRPFHPALYTRPLFNARRPLDLSNLLNLRDVELIPPRKVTITRGRSIRPEGIGYKIPNPIFDHITDSSNNILNTSPTVADFNISEDCLSDGSKIDTNIPDKNKIHTNIISSVPTSYASNIAKSDLIHQAASHHSNPADTQIPTDGSINSSPGSALRPVNPVTDESRNSFNILASPRGSNNLKYFNPDSSDTSKHMSNMRESSTISDNSDHQTNEVSAVKDAVLKKIEDFKQANAIRYENLRSSLNDVLKIDTGRELPDKDCSLSKIINTDEHFKEDRSSDSIKNKVSMKDLQQMSDNILKSNNNEGTEKSNAKSTDQYTHNNEDRITYPRTPQTSFPIEKPINNDNFRENAGTDTLLHTNNFPMKMRENDLNSDATNHATCLTLDNLNEHQRHLNNEMRTAASEPANKWFPDYQYSHPIPKSSNIRNYLSNPVVDDPLEDINLDIFQYQPSLKEINGLRNLQLPRVNMKSYKTQLPIPDTFGLKPVKLQQAFRTGRNDILGATLTIKPHMTGKSNELLNHNMRSSQPNGLGIPNIEDIRSFFENTTPDVLKLPFLKEAANNNYALPSVMRLSNTNRDLRTFAEEALNNVQDTVGNVFREANKDHHLIADTILNPSDVIETIAEAHDNANDRLSAFHMDLSDRLKKFHQSLTGQSRIPQQHERTPLSIYNTDRINLRNNKHTPNIRTSLDRGNVNIKPSTVKQNPALFSPRTVTPRKSTLNLSTLKPETTQKEVNNMRLGQKPVAKRPIPLHERLRLAKENKGIISFTDRTVKPPILESLPKNNPISSRRPITIPKQADQPTKSRSALPELSTLTRKKINKEPQTSPSDVAYTKIPTTTRTVIPKASLCDEVNEKQTLDDLPQIRSSRPKTASSPRSLLKNSVLPTIAENAFLSKVREAVMPKKLLTNGNNGIYSKDDGIPSASETIGLTEPSEDISFDCKMVCSKS